MMMGEVGEESSVNQQRQQQQDLQVAETVVVEDDDEDEADIAAKEATYRRRVQAISLTSDTGGRSSDAANSSTPTNAGSSSSVSSIFDLANLPPKQLAEWKSLARRHAKQHRGSPIHLQLKAQRELQLKFLEVLYVRNVLLQSLPNSVSQGVETVESSSSETTTPSSPHRTNNASVDKSSSSYKNSESNNSNHKLEESSVERRSCKGGGGDERDDAAVAVSVPKASAISEYRPYSGDWYNCLKGKAMNDREPEHLLKATYDNYVHNEANKLWLSKQKKKARRGTGAALRTELDCKSSGGGDPKSSPSSSNSTPIANKSKSLTDGPLTTTSSPTTSFATDSNSSFSSPQKPESITSESQMRSRSKDRETQEPPRKDEQNNNPHAAVATPSSIHNADENRLSKVGAISSTEELDVSKRSMVLPSTLSTKKGNDLSKSESIIIIGTNPIELNEKSVISENTDSSSSGSTNISSNSFNENVSISRASSNAAVGSANNSNPSSTNTNTSTPVANHGGVKSNKKLLSGPKAPKKYSEKMKAEASVLQRITELQKEGMWWEKRLPKVYEPPRTKAHWDYLLEEMTWMATDFANERKWKRNAAKKCARMIEKYYHDKELKRQKAEKDEEVRKKKTAGTIAKMVRQFWSNAQTLVEFKEQTIIESLRKKALDQKLSYLVNETEKYSEIVAQTFTAIAKETGIQSEESIQASDISPVPSTPVKSVSIKEEVNSPLPPNEDDGEFVPPSDSESDVDDTIVEEEAKEKVEQPDHTTELDDLEAENNMSIEELYAKYSKYLHNPDAYKEPEVQSKPQERRVTRGRGAVGRPLRSTRRQPLVTKLSESDIETDVEDNEDEGGSSTEEESHGDDPTSETDKADDDLASLLKSISSDTDQKKNTEEETNKLADLAESFKPKGNTLSSTTVATKVPYILRHQLREYQHIGLDWLVTMYDKRLNGILADEMGLGKTIQTIALLAYLAVDRCNWGPHLIIVPTSVMLNWEMEFKKWCPGFKILTYYGSQKERKQKRSGWTKPNAFHVCITSYKLVIQDHQSFRRKRWKYLILDEAHNIKNFKSLRWQLLLNFHTQRRLLLTGTPLQNNLMELWSLLHFLMPNVFQSHMEFKDWFSNPMSGMVEGSQEYNEDIVRRLHKVLRPFILRRMKSEVEKQLPNKYEHVVMCSLSKRQRYLYDEFMSRSKTKDTLNQGNLLSVINVLMQLRKVCNHPNLFEPRPIASPFQTEGISCNLPAVVWNMLREIQEDSFRTHFPLFNLSNRSTCYDEDDAKRIDELTPLFAYNPDEERRYVIMNYVQCETEQPPAKRPRRIVNLVKKEPPACPVLSKPLTFFMSVGRPDQVLQDRDFVDCLGRDAASKRGSVKALNDEGSLRTPSTVKNHTKPTEDSALSTDKQQMVVDLSDSENENERGSSEESDCEFVVVRKRKTPVARFNVATRLEMMGCSVPDFSLDYIQERKLQDRKAVVDKLNKVNWNRCCVPSILGPRLVDSCRVVGALPPIRLTSRRTGCRIRSREKSRDFRDNGYFNVGIGEIMKIIRIREENPALRHHPYAYLSMSKYLDALVPTPESRIGEIMEVLTRYVMYIPAVSAPALESHLYRPATSGMYFNRLSQLDEYRKEFAKPTEIIHPIVSRMLTQFPDPRLIQYDCGKLQTMDKLLRRLKTENHRVLIFTQMAKVLDILEAFLNYNGHTYLRLDGATKIDQRQLLMERFNADKKIFCFILSTRSGGIGVNLTGADTVIFYDSDWNPTMDAQAQDRCHRIGQTRDVHIYKLVSEKTVEENILKKSNQKRLLGELAIEGGKFTTTYFKQHTIRDLFTINEKDDVAKRLSTWDNEPSSSSGQRSSKDDDEESSSVAVDLLRSPEKKYEMQMIECALAAAEDDTDVQAAQTVHAEAEAEMAEFDESVSLDALDDGKTGPNRFELEFQQVYERMTDVERYALRLMESTIDDWSKETVAQAQKDLEEQKLAWELQQQKAVQESKMEIDDSSCQTEDLLTYARVEATSQVWVAQFGSFEQDMPFMIYEPPTPPIDEMDVYFDFTHGYLYDYDVMNESQLPPVYVPKHPKKLPVPPSPVTKPGTEKVPEPPKEVPPETGDVDGDTSPHKKSPKVARREDPIFAPKSLFDRPSPAMAKIRRDLRLQRYSCRPASASPKTTLGPGSITFPIVNPTAQKPLAPPTPKDSPDWLLAEDFSLLQTIRNVSELPISLIVVNLAQTPNWDFAAEAVNMVGFSNRTAKQCKYRYENFVAPREEGKLLYDPPTTSDPGSPSAGKKKKAKTFIKIAPPSPSKAARNMKVSQLLSQDDNAQFRSIFTSKFDTIKSIANKRAPTTKPILVNPANAKSNKHAQVFAEHGIQYDNPLPATVIAQARYDRIQVERKKMEMARQQAAVAAAAASGAVATTLGGVPATIIGPGSVSAAALAAANANASGVGVKQRFTSVQLPSMSAPLVLQGTAAELLNRENLVTLPSIVAQHRRPIDATGAPQLFIQQPQKMGIAHPGPNPPHQVTPQLTTVTQPPQSNMTVLTTGAVGTTQSQQILRTSAPIQVHQTPQTQTQTVVLATGLAQALAASVGSPIAVSSAPIATSTPLVSAVSTSPAMQTQIPQIRHSMAKSTIATQQQIQRLPTITMQDLVSSSTTQRIQTGIITTSAPSVQSVGQPQSSQPTLVSLTPMLGTNNQQLATKLIQNPQGLATLVQTSPRPGGQPMTQQASAKLPLQLQYFRQSGLIRQASPVSVAQQQQVQTIKDQLAGGPQQIKRIQVVTASAPPTIVSSSSGIPQQATVSLPSISTITSNAYSTVPVIPATSTPVVTISTAGGTASKVSLAQSTVTMAISSPNVSPATASAVLAQQSQRQVQLVKQHTVGGKTVTRPVTDAEVQAFLKHHGIPTISNPVSGQNQLGGGGTQVATFPSVQGQPTLLTVGLQNLMKVQQSGGGPLATLVKTPGGQVAQTTAGGTLAFPVHVSKIKGASPGTGLNPKQQPVQTLGVQQVMIQRRQPQESPQGNPQQLQTAGQAQHALAAATHAAASGKIAHITTQVTPQGNIPTHVVVQTTQKQLPNTLAVQQLQQVFKQVGATGQLIGQGGQVVQAQMLTKPIAVSGQQNTITVTTSGATSSPLAIPQSATSTASLVHIPNIVQGAGSSPIHARIVPVSVNVAQQPGGVKQTIQVVSGPPPPNAAIIGQGQMAVRPPPPNTSNVQAVNTIQIKIPTSSTGTPNAPPDDKS